MLTSEPPTGLSVRLVPRGLPPRARQSVLGIEVAADMAVELPDRSALWVDASAVLERTSAVETFALLVECRRALAVGGRLIVGPAPQALSLPRFASLAGLVPHDGSRLAEFTKPQRQVDGQPLVSIVIPAYAPRFFASALASAIGQTYEALEIVVCDESEGDTIESIARLASRQRRLRYLRNPARLGTRGNLARGLGEARGEFIKYLNDDDLLAPDCVAQLVAAFADTPDVVLATSWRRRIDARDQPLPDQPATTPLASEDVLIAGSSLANAMLLAGLNIVGEPSSVLFRRADFDASATDPFHFDGTAGRGAVDFAMWANLLLRGDVVWYRRCLSEFRIHPGQSQQDASKRPRAVEGIRSLQRAWLALGLHRFLRQSEVLRRPLPPRSADGWQWSRVEVLARIAEGVWRAPPSDRWQYATSPALLHRQR